MVIPERTRTVHKVMVPFFILKLGVFVVSLSAVFLVVLGIDYIHMLGRTSENKVLKGENFKLRQEVQMIRNKVETMETTIERVRNYAKKLQMMTGQGDKNAPDLPWGPTSEAEPEREPSNYKKNSEKVHGAIDSIDDPNAVLLSSRVDKLSEVSLIAETNLSKMHVYLLGRSALMNATPSLLPIAGWISSKFGYRNNPYDGTYKLHAGVDIAAEPGTPVRAPADGLVIFSGYREGYGKAVVIDHGYGIRTLFAHNSVLFVNSTTRVKRGETIAQVGNTGHSTGPHLHYEVRKNGVPVNPANFFNRVRF